MVTAVPEAAAAPGDLADERSSGQVSYAAVGIGGQASDGRLSRRLLLGHAARPFACIRRRPTDRRIDPKTATNASGLR